MLNFSRVDFGYVALWDRRQKIRDKIRTETPPPILPSPCAGHNRGES